MSSDRIIGIVLSAGLSGRMNNFKPLLKLKNGKTFIQSIIEKLNKVCDEVIIVTGFRSEEIVDHLNSVFETGRLNFVPNKDYKNGMFTSLQAGLEKCNSEWYLYHFVDQPSLPIEFYSHFIRQIETGVNWIQPIFENRKGHPILFDEFVKEKILKSDSSQNLRKISRDKSIQKKFWKCDTELIFEDIDTEDDYRKSNSFDCI